MRNSSALISLALVLSLLGCDRQQETGGIDPQQGLDCFEQRRASLPPGTQYEGIEQLTDDGLVIRIMNGLEVVTVECKLDASGAVQGVGN